MIALVEILLTNLTSIFCCPRSISTFRVFEKVWEFQFRPGIQNHGQGQDEHAPRHSFPSSVAEIGVAEASLEFVEATNALRDTISFSYFQIRH